MIVQHFFPHGNHIADVDLMPGIFLRNLHFQHHIGLFQPTEQGRNRFAYLKIHGSVFDLEDHIVIKLSVQRHEVVIGGLGPVGLVITPVLLAVVNKTAPNQDSFVVL